MAIFVLLFQPGTPFLISNLKRMEPSAIRFKHLVATVDQLLRSLEEYVEVVDVYKFASGVISTTFHERIGISERWILSRGCTLEEVGGEGLVSRVCGNTLGAAAGNSCIHIDSGAEFLDG